jgi:hypothetical protein
MTIFNKLIIGKCKKIEDEVLNKCKKFQKIKDMPKE